MMKVPQGSESFFFEEAFIHRKITETLQNLYNAWGYLPVETPVFDLYDVYRELIPSGDDERIYRLIDRDGDLLMLRSDVTLFLARQMGLILSEEDLPVRVCYSDSILRHQDSEDISHNEFYQTGVELIGRGGFRGDMEILLLLAETVKLLEIPVRVHLGSHALFNLMFAGFSEKKRLGLQKAISLRDFEKVAEITGEETGEYGSKKIAKLFGFIGGVKEFTEFINENEDSFHIDISDELKYLNSLVSSLENAGFTDLFTLDLSEIGNQAYHTGIVFQVYMDEVDSAVISGGRYDNLLLNFGINAPSVGFSMLQRKIEPGIGNRKRFAPPADIFVADDENVMEAFKKALELRKEGKIAVI